MSLTTHEKKRIEDRVFNIYKSQLRLGSWSDYWKANKKSYLQSAILFKGLLSENGFNRYLEDHDLNPWTIYNIENLNG